MEKQKIVSDDPLAMVITRNLFYRKKFHFFLGIYFLSLISIVFLLGTIYYLVTHPTRPLYFATDTVGRLIQDVPLMQPNMSDADVAKWVTDAIQAAYSYDFVNYHAQFQEAQKYFTQFGWGSYMTALDQSDNLLALEKYKYVVTAKVVNPPKLIRKGPLSGAFAWKFEVPVLVTYSTPPYTGSGFKNPLLVSIIVQRQKILQSYEGLGVVQMIAVLQA